MNIAFPFTRWSRKECVNKQRKKNIFILTFLLTGAISPNKILIILEMLGSRQVLSSDQTALLAITGNPTPKFNKEQNYVVSNGLQ